MFFVFERSPARKRFPLLNVDKSQRIFKVIYNLKGCFDFARKFVETPEKTLKNTHTCDISQVILTLQGHFGLARQKVKNNLKRFSFILAHFRHMRSQNARACCLPL